MTSLQEQICLLQIGFSTNSDEKFDSIWRGTGVCLAWWGSCSGAYR